jgi:hypothetical protein
VFVGTKGRRQSNRSFDRTTTLSALAVVVVRAVAAVPSVAWLVRPTLRRLVVGMAQDTAKRIPHTVGTKGQQCTKVMAAVAVAVATVVVVQSNRAWLVQL